MFEGKILRVLSDPPLSGFENMSRDEVLWENLAKGETMVLRFFHWREKTLSVGRFQRTQDICWEYLYRSQIPLVRRPTGGRAILHQNEITLSLVLPATNDISPRRYYQELKVVMVRALQKVGINLDY
ncbi:MAG: lipoate--protein ligase family protein [Candidatus Caldatribacteriaceae bacterium]